MFDTSMLMLFRKRITADMLNETNEYLLVNKDEDKEEAARTKMPVGRKLLTKGHSPWMPPVSQPTSSIPGMHSVK